MIRRLALVLALTGLLGALTSAPSAAFVRWSDSDAVLAGTAVPTSGSLYAFSSLLEGKPVRWNPCAAIHWRFRAAGAPSGGLAVITGAVARVAKATGTRWVYDGLSTATPVSTWLPRSTSGIRPVLIGWTDAAHSDLLAGKPAGVLGVTRTAWFGVRVDGRSVAAIRTAVIALDRTDKLPLTGSVSWRTVALHELTHAMGMSHAGSSRQLMYPVLQRGLTDLQSGDLLGLSKVGRNAGCVTIPA